MRGNILGDVERAERPVIFGDASPQLFERDGCVQPGGLYTARVLRAPQNDRVRGQPAKPAEALRRPKYFPAARRFKTQKLPFDPQRAGLKLRTNLSVCSTLAQRPKKTAFQSVARRIKNSKYSRG